jgi:hypothetical protein
VFVVSALVGGVGVSVAGVPGGLSNRTVSVGSTYTILGQTGTLRPGAVRATGPVTLSGRWDGGRSQVLAQTSTAADGHFRLSITLRRRGLLELRLGTPDRHVERVVLTVV